MIESDILIIGGGPGGYETAVRAAALGHSVTLIERDLLGGTCLNRGCIPTKTLCRSAEVMMTAAKASEFGVSTSFPSIDFAAVMARKDAVVKDLREGVETLLSGVNVVKGEARFLSSSLIEADGETFTAKTIIIATGSAPARLPISGAEHALTSDEFLSLSRLPESVVIIGGGVIGMEFASVLNAFGAKVTVLEYCREILPPFDSEVAKRLRMSLKKRGIEIVTGAKVTALDDSGRVLYECKGKQKEVVAETVLKAVGRRAVLPPGLLEAGVETERGFIHTDASFRIIWQEGTAPENVDIYAIGDVNGRCMLAHAATAQGESVLGEKINLNVIPSAVFTVPECAMVGLTEEECLARGLEIKIGKSTFRSNGKAVSMGETDGLVKVIESATDGKLLGCHICGPHAADLIAEAAVVMSSGLPASAITHTIHSHPTLSEIMPAAVRSAH